jgi:ubiquinone/menaquinone biosynthesis C-methylase UbiE
MAGRLGRTGRVVGVDLSRELIDQARTRAAELGERIRFEVGDAQSLAFPDASFDACREDRAWQPIADPARTVPRRAKAGGRTCARDAARTVLATINGCIAPGTVAA